MARISVQNTNLYFKVGGLGWGQSVIVPTPIFNKDCFTEFAESRTAALRTAALLHVLLSIIYFLHSDVSTQNAWLQALSSYLNKEKEVTLNSILDFEFFWFNR